jgi:hypothetical protein
LYHFSTFSAVSATEQRKTAAFLPLQCWYSWLLANPEAMEPGISYELKMNRTWLGFASSFEVKYDKIWIIVCKTLIYSHQKGETDLCFFKT